jgi:hypothetical protein
VSNLPKPRRTHVEVFAREAVLLRQLKTLRRDREEPSPGSSSPLGIVKNCKAQELLDRQFVPEVALGAAFAAEAWPISKSYLSPEKKSVVSEWLPSFAAVAE